MDKTCECVSHVSFNGLLQRAPTRGNSRVHYWYLCFKGLLKKHQWRGFFLMQISHPITGGSRHKSHFCRDKHVFCCDKIRFLATRQTRVCRDNSFVAASILLSQKRYLWQLPPMIWSTVVRKFATKLHSRLPAVLQSALRKALSCLLFLLHSMQMTALVLTQHNHKTILL